MTHFASEHVEGKTLCGLDFTAIILKERVADCQPCVNFHALNGWTFPIPALVTTDTSS
jgi:hypothetical protein